MPPPGLAAQAAPRLAGFHVNDFERFLGGGRCEQPVLCCIGGHVVEAALNVGQSDSFGQHECRLVLSLRPHSQYQGQGKNCGGKNFHKGQLIMGCKLHFSGRMTNEFFVIMD